MKYQEIIKKVSKDTGISIEVVDKTYKGFWNYIRNSVQGFSLKENLTETEFLGIRPNFNIPSLGKLCVSFDRYTGVHDRFKYINNLRKRYDKVAEG